jgi:hypothetical protein
MMRELLTDGKTGGLSSSRLTMILSVILSVAMYGWAAVMVTLAYSNYGPQAVPLMDLSWYLYGGTGSGLLGVGAYAFNQYGNRNIDPTVITTLSQTQIQNGEIQIGDKTDHLPENVY